MNERPRHATRRRRTLGSIARAAVLVLATALMLFPLYWLLIMAFKPRAEWNPPGEVIWWPRDPTLDNFREILGLSGGGQFVTALLDFSAVRPLLNSLAAATGGTILAVAAGLGAAYALSRFPGRRRIFAFQALQLRMFPPLVLLIGLLFLWVEVGLYDTLPGLVIAYAALTMPIALWLMRSFLTEVPRELAEAAIVDGCTHWGAFVRVVLPQVKGALAATVLIVFVLNWSDLVVALALTQNRAETAPVFLTSLQVDEGGDLFGLQAALSLLLVVPPLALALVVRRHLVRGLTFGAIKV